MSSSEPQGVRLQKVLSKAGIASRRVAEDMIAEGRVAVDGEIVTEQGRRVDPELAVIHVDGLRVMVTGNLVHLALNKPRGVHTTMSDDRGRPCVGDYVADHEERLFHVGRLDAETEGLLLLTNDGELAHRLMHPSYNVYKTYLVEVAGPVHRDLGRKLLAGVELEDGPVRLDKYHVKDANGGRVLIEVVLHEGRNRIVRRLFDSVGHPVLRLVRTAVGEVRLAGLRPSALRPLTRAEVGALYKNVGL
ncbi:MULTISPECIES: pseudouridine synthase [unclassified Crossiella]|uniref:pseudouridine synthase n=1 Tax=unclassified Crossiella TaxID=2620835 RepID=UPI001FFE6C2D|nr:MULTISPECIES: pseudouridine synthase [unclassified Crossiella]MCK2243851.1 rRNA pseudouridine synthase [Crossiella sp. S99.2]MCK2257710.1 rRNA pseudouridine synthase [Crossiella sp. S99.1]